jgi:spermidine/putrescine transport system permease protein
MHGHFITVYKRGSVDMVRKAAGWGYALIVFVFLYAPIAVLMLMSFNASQYNALPFRFSTHWYSVLFSDQTLIGAAASSLIIALITGVVCVVLGTMLTLWMVQSQSKWKKWVDSLVILPLTIPWLILGLSILLLLTAMGVDKNFVVLQIGHIIVSLPYTILVLKARLQSMDLSVNEASLTLGANDWTTYRRITLPLLFPAMLAGGFLAFVVSFDNFIISYFLLPTGSTTLPVEIYTSIKFGFTPEINALSTILLCIVMMMILFIVGTMKSSLKSMIK